MQDRAGANRRKVKYGTRAWEAAQEQGRVKTNFQTEPQAMILRENQYMWYHIITIATPSIYLTHSFQGGQRSSPAITILPSWGLGPAEDGWGLSLIWTGEREALEVNVKITGAVKEIAEPSVWAWEPIGKRQRIENQFSKGPVHTKLSGKSQKLTLKRIDHCQFTCWEMSTRRRYRGTSRSWDIGRVWSRDGGISDNWKTAKSSSEKVCAFTGKAPSKPRSSVLSISELFIWQIDHSAKWLSSNWSGGPVEFLL